MLVQNLEEPLHFIRTRLKLLLKFELRMRVRVNPYIKALIFAHKNACVL